MNAVRFSICALILLAFLWKRLKGVSRHDLFVGILTGTMMFGGFVGQTTGLMFTSVGNNAFITSAYVILVPFIAWALTRVRPGINNFVAVFFCLLGIGFLTLQGGFSLSRGDTITMMGAMFFGFEIALLGIYAKKMDPLLLALLEALVVGILFWIYAFLFESPPEVIDRSLVLSMAYITFFGSVITHILVTVALKYTSSSHGALLCATEAVFGVILASLFLGERFSRNGWIGSALVLLAVIIAEVGEGIIVKNRKRTLDAMAGSGPGAVPASEIIAEPVLQGDNEL
jgi:drug/metabolite transporter (DMT)-like permease